MNHKKLTGTAAALFLGTAALAQTANAGMDASLADNTASFTVTHGACTSDKHLFSVGIGLDFAAKNGAEEGAMKTSVDSFRAAYNEGFGKTVDKMMNLMVGSQSYASLKNTVVAGAITGRVETDPAVAAQIDALRPEFDAGSAVMSAKLEDLSGNVALDEPTGIAVKLSLTAVPSPKCQ